MSFTHFIPTRILFGKGTLKQLHSQALPGKKALIVLSAGGSMKRCGYLATVENELKAAGITWEIYDKIQPNPIKEHVMEGAAIAKEKGCDFIIGLGGGSSIDSAKAIAIMAANEGDYWDYVSGGTGKGKTPANAPLPLVAITTTAGTGTEADMWTVITKSETNEKIGGGFEGTFPVLSIVDPDTMMSIPPALTAYQGFDALFHSTEGYLSTNANTISDLYALKAIELVGKSLEKAVNHGSGYQAREDVALANTLAGMVESTSTCLSEHSIAHAISAHFPEIPHGAALIMVSRAYYEIAAEGGNSDERMMNMARAMGVGNPHGPKAFVDALVDLQKKCGVYDLKLSDYGVTREDLPVLAENALDTMGGLFAGNPCEIDSLKVLERSYR